MTREILSLALWALLALGVVSAVAADEQKVKLVSSVSIEGFVFCDHCLQDRATKKSDVLKGAKVAVACESRVSAAASAGKEVVTAITDGQGRFNAEVPKGAFDSAGRIKCVAEVKESPVETCRLRGKWRRGSEEFRRLEVGGGAVIYAAGEFSYRPESAGLFCAQNSYSPYYKSPSYQSSPYYQPLSYQPVLSPPPPPPPPPPPVPTPSPPPSPPPPSPPYSPTFKFSKFKIPSFRFPTHKYPYHPRFKFPPFNFPKFKIPRFRFPKYKYPYHPPSKPWPSSSKNP